MPDRKKVGEKRKKKKTKGIHAQFVKKKDAKARMNSWAERERRRLDTDGRKKESTSKGKRDGNLVREKS